MAGKKVTLVAVFLVASLAWGQEVTVQVTGSAGSANFGPVEQWSNLYNSAASQSGPQSMSAGNSIPSVDSPPIIGQYNGIPSGGNLMFSQMGQAATGSFLNLTKTTIAVGVGLAGLVVGGATGAAMFAGGFPKVASAVGKLSPMSQMGRGLGTPEAPPKVAMGLSKHPETRAKILRPFARRMNAPTMTDLYASEVEAGTLDPNTGLLDYIPAKLDQIANTPGGKIFFTLEGYDPMHQYTHGKMVTDWELDYIRSGAGTTFTNENTIWIGDEPFWWAEGVPPIE
jgi:hypothetical protein